MADFLFDFLLLITFSIPMYIMCVILCLFIALSHRVGALQISIIIKIIMIIIRLSETHTGTIYHREGWVVEIFLVRENKIKDKIS